MTRTLAVFLYFLQAGCWQAVVEFQVPPEVDGEVSEDAAERLPDETMLDLASDEIELDPPYIEVDHGDVEAAGEETLTKEDEPGRDPPREDVVGDLDDEGDLEEEEDLEEEDLDEGSESGPICGNGIRESGEECDGDPPGYCGSPCWVLECIDCAWVCYHIGLGDCCECCWECEMIGMEGACCACYECWCYEEPPESYCGLGVCQRRAICSSPGGMECTPGPPTGDDNDCNGLDDDCDGLCDEHYLPVRCGVGVCERGSVCNCGVEISCTPGAPIAPDDATCDGLDDDCDGLVDEDCLA